MIWLFFLYHRVTHFHGTGSPEPATDNLNNQCLLPFTISKEIPETFTDIVIMDFYSHTKYKTVYMSIFYELLKSSLENDL